MRKVSIFFVLGIILFVLAYFLVSQLSPFKIEAIKELAANEKILQDDWQSLDGKITELIDRGIIFSYLSENSYIAFALILGGIMCVFIALHLIIDKIFFKNFYESANMNMAVRRGIFIVISIALIMMLRLYRAEPLLGFIVPLTAFLVELLILNSRKDTIDEEPSDSEVREITRQKI